LLKAFFLIADGESLLIDCEADRRADLVQRLKTYKLRSKIEIAEADYTLYAIFDAASPVAGAIAYTDPPTAALGLRILLPADTDESGFGLPELPFETYDRLRIAEAVPD